MYSMHYVDAEQPDGLLSTKQVKLFIGNLNCMSERAARSEHARIMAEVNIQRGSVRPLLKGQTFNDAVAKWRAAIAPNLSPATVRPRESFLRTHIMPRFKDTALQGLGVGEIQQFATDLYKKLKVYAHAIPQTQRDAMEQVGRQSLRRGQILRFEQAN
jgi:hypothetical protein